MGQVTVEINGKPYTVGCEDGQEGHLRELAALFDRQVRIVAQEVGSLGDTRGYRPTTRARKAVP